MTANLGCEIDVVHIMNEWYKALGTLKSMIGSNIGLGINEKKMSL